MNNNLEENINKIKNHLEEGSSLIVKKFFIGTDEYIEAALIFINGLVDKNAINRDILQPLMIEARENLKGKEDLESYICKKYICVGDNILENDINKTVDSIKFGNAVLILEDCLKYIIIESSGGNYRAISEPENESTVRGPREAFIENMEINLSIIKRRIKDKNLVIEKFVIGKISQSEVAMVYIKGIVNEKTLKSVRDKIKNINKNIDVIIGVGQLGQYIENHTYSVFPQYYITERADVVEANIVEGKIGLFVEGSPQVATVPALFIEFFQTSEDYYQRFIVASFIRFLRIISIFVVISFSSIYLNFAKFNIEALSIKLALPIIRSRSEIALNPFFEILIMEVFIEVLREGGIRLPSKVAQTLSVIGGIIIGEMSVRAKIVSPDTLLVVGASVIASFLIPNYEMTLTIRLLKFPLLVISNFMGALGIVLFWFVMIVHLLSLDSFGVPYISLNQSDLKDIFIRAPLWKMDKRPEDIGPEDKVRQRNFKYRRFKFGNKE
ncbi:spore germination protein [Clostridium malenominatum]|uniref:Spore germination protein n=1 Tax=Clostridium malenominatum TaxID=1539 RepID=A0ABN1J7P2_9CLOT